MLVREIHGATSNVYKVEQIVTSRGIYYANLSLDDIVIDGMFQVDKLLPAGPIGTGLDWHDIRVIVKLADIALETHSKKALLEMGERGYYEEVLKAYECHVLDKLSCCDRTNVATEKEEA